MAHMYQQIMFNLLILQIMQLVYFKLNLSQECSTPKHDIYHDISGFNVLDSSVYLKLDDVGNIPPTYQNYVYVLLI